MNLALKVHDDDNIAILFTEEVLKGSPVEVVDKAGGKQNVTALSPIPYGHKIALQPITKGANILKYGESIGIAASEIAVGEHVHVHNLESMRGRGDL